MIINKFLSLLNRYKTDLPTFTIVGVGPGDPSLLTIAAVNAIKKAKVIVFPISDDNKKSFASEIVKKYTKFKKNIPIIFPMARRNVDPDEIWSNAVEKIVKFINNGESVVLLCLGDTSLFASSSNILRIIKNNYPEIITKTIPGISSISAAAAAFNDFHLVKKGETLIIKECPSSNSELTSLIKESKRKKIVLAIMKVGKRWNLVREILKKELKIKLIEQNRIKDNELQSLQSKLNIAEEKKTNALNDLRNQATNKINSFNNELIKI